MNEQTVSFEDYKRAVPDEIAGRAWAEYVLAMGLDPDVDRDPDRAPFEAVLRVIRHWLARRDKGLPGLPDELPDTLPVRVRRRADSTLNAQDAAGLLAASCLANALEISGADLGADLLRPWLELSALEREMYRRLGGLLFGAGKAAGVGESLERAQAQAMRAAVLELTDQATTWQAFADQADKRARELGQEPTPETRWADRAVAYERVARELSTRADELAGRVKPRPRPAPLGQGRSPAQPCT